MIRITIFLIFISAICWARPEIEFLSEVEVSSRDNLFIKDIALFKNHDLEILNEVGSISIKELGGDEQKTLRLTLSEIISKIKDVPLIKNKNIKMNIPQQIKVTIATNKVSKEELQRNISNYLSVSCAECTYEVMITNIPQPMSHAWEFDFKQLNSKGPFLISLIENKNRTNRWGAGIIKVRQKVLVTSHLVRMGDKIQPNDVKFDEIDVTHLRDTLAKESEVIGWVANKTLYPEQPIVMSDLKKEYAVKRGQVVKVIIGNKQFEISSQMTSEENGFLGDVIKLKQADAQKYLSGKIEDQGIVRIQ